MKRDANIEAYRLLRRFVPEFRDFVRGQLVGRYGAERWLDRVPEDVRQRLSEFEKKWRENPWVSTCAESPLDFSYEEDLIRIVTEEDNWRNVFRNWFGSDKRVIETKLREIRWLRDHVAHFRAVDREQEAKLRALCKEVTLCIARAAKIQADAAAPEGLLSPDDLLSGEEVAQMLARKVRAARLGQPGRPSATEGARALEIDGVLEQFVQQTEFDLGAAPDESEVQPAKVHKLYEEWEDSPPDEVLAWQSYAPRGPVVEGSKVHLAIRYNPVALKVAGAKGQGPGFRWCRRSVACWVTGELNLQWVRPGADVLRRARFVSWEEHWERNPPLVKHDLGDVTLEPKGWAFLEYVPPAAGLYHVFWYHRRSYRLWVGDLFWVEGPAPTPPPPARSGSPR